MVQVFPPKIPFLGQGLGLFIPRFLRSWLCANPAAPEVGEPFAPFPRVRPVCPSVCPSMAIGGKLRRGGGSGAANSSRHTTTQLACAFFITAQAPSAAHRSLVLPTTIIACTCFALRPSLSFVCLLSFLSLLFFLAPCWRMVMVGLACGTELRQEARRSLGSRLLTALR